ncbi:hypothetical protein BKA70DRAFT_1532709 [Coprinopsis sp. MPI-PUGE-AT-0042]|nr:hypothetical protein BKA70DRAFT_1532709 [Coprinopsis sp. MPI-PUGE-AT-0042]
MGINFPNPIVSPVGAIAASLATRQQGREDNPYNQLENHRYLCALSHCLLCARNPFALSIEPRRQRVRIAKKRCKSGKIRRLSFGRLLEFDPQTTQLGQPTTKYLESDDQVKGSVQKIGNSVKLRLMLNASENEPEEGTRLAAPQLRSRPPASQVVIALHTSAGTLYGANSKWPPSKVTDPSHHVELSTTQQPSGFSINIASYHEAGAATEKLERCEAEERQRLVETDILAIVADGPHCKGVPHSNHPLTLVCSNGEIQSSSILSLANASILPSRRKRSRHPGHGFSQSPDNLSRSLKRFYQSGGLVDQARRIRNERLACSIVLGREFGPHESPISGRIGRPRTSRSHAGVQETENALVELDTTASSVIDVRNRAFCLLPGADLNAAGIIQPRRMDGTGGVGTAWVGVDTKHQ